MMMPANFSAVAENEMTYVVGGGLVDVLAPVMTTENWQNINANIIYLVGNGVLESTAVKGLGYVFGGNYEPGKLLSAGWDDISNTFNHFTGDWAGAKGALNVGLKLLGYAASIYTLGNKQIGLDITKKAGFTVTAPAAKSYT